MKAQTLSFCCFQHLRYYSCREIFKSKFLYERYSRAETASCSLDKISLVSTLRPVATSPLQYLTLTLVLSPVTEGWGYSKKSPGTPLRGVYAYFFFYCRSVYKIRLYLPVFPPSFHLLSTPHEVGCKAKCPLAQLSGFVWCTLLTISNIRETLFVFYSKGQYWRGSCDCALYHSRNTEVFPQWTHCLPLRLPVLLTKLWDSFHCWRWYREILYTAEIPAVCKSVCL